MPSSSMPPAGRFTRASNADSYSPTGGAAGLRCRLVGASLPQCVQRSVAVVNDSPARFFRLFQERCIKFMQESRPGPF
jgi:hypothetical protein